MIMDVQAHTHTQAKQEMFFLKKTFLIEKDVCMKICFRFS